MNGDMAKAVTVEEIQDLKLKPDELFFAWAGFLRPSRTLLKFHVHFPFLRA